MHFQSDNSYFDQDGHPVVLPFFCLLMDLLGVTKQAKDCKTTDESTRLCRTLFRIQDQQRQLLNPAHDNSDWLHSWHFQTLSDTTMIAHPIDHELAYGEPELADIIQVMAHCQMLASEQGFFSRGALAANELHCSDTLWYGKALIEAHESETKYACYPRIIVAPSVFPYICQHLQWYASPSASPHAQYFLIDEGDNKVFINYLATANSFDECGTDTAMLSKHRSHILAAMEQFKDNQNVMDKYYWLCDYHNFFCKQCMWFSEEARPGQEAVNNLYIKRNQNASRAFRIIDDIEDSALNARR